jgi:hypothetical protein
LHDASIRRRGEREVEDLDMPHRHDDVRCGGGGVPPAVARGAMLALDEVMPDLLGERPALLGRMPLLVKQTLLLLGRTLLVLGHEELVLGNAKLVSGNAKLVFGIVELFFGKQRKLTGYATGTKLWVRFATVRWGMQSDWCTPVLVTIP